MKHRILAALLVIAAAALMIVGGIMASGAPDYTETVRIVGVDDAGDLVVVRLDADGNIVAVLKADYDGTLQTLACDSQGRLVAVIDDEINLFASRARIGNAELAARLGSIQLYERRGSAVFLESFEQGLLRWAATTSGLGSAVGLTSECSKSGGYAVLLTGGSNLFRTATIWHTERLVNTDGLIGIEFSFRDVDLTDAFIELMFTVDDGIDGHTGGFRWGIAADNVDIWKAGAWDERINGAFGSSNLLSWSTVKIVVDPTTMKYVRMYFNGLAVDLSAVGLTATGATIGDSVEAYIRVQSEAGENSQFQVDNFILTINEPEE